MIIGGHGRAATMRQIFLRGSNALIRGTQKKAAPMRERLGMELDGFD